MKLTNFYLPFYWYQNSWHSSIYFVSFLTLLVQEYPSLCTNHGVLFSSNSCIVIFLLWCIVAIDVLILLLFCIVLWFAKQYWIKNTGTTCCFSPLSMMALDFKATFLPLYQTLWMCGFICVCRVIKLANSRLRPRTRRWLYFSK